MLFGRKNSLWREVSPTGAVRDFIQVWNENPHRWRTLAVAIAMTAAMLIVFAPKTEYAPPREPEITYISTFESGRTQQQIIASNLTHEKQEQAIRAQEAKREELRRQVWEAIGRASFVDVDSLKKQAAQDEAARKQADAQIAARNQARLEEQAKAAGK
jgi:hypothetical protein